jgi:c-di-GMP-binding flagellar brake protein YcgR
VEENNRLTGSYRFHLADDPNIQGDIRDLSVSGAGFRVAGGKESLAETLQEMGEFFLVMDLKGTRITGQASFIWGVNLGDEFMGGLKFSTISPEDRLSLAEIVDNLREDPKVLRSS